MRIIRQILRVETLIGVGFIAGWALYIKRPTPLTLGKVYARAKGALPTLVRDALELFLTRNSVLRTSGWRLSRKEGSPVDASSGPIPWYTYPSIRFLEPKVRHDFRVFEYGSGHSTLWWASRVSEVVSVEHHKGWFDRISEGLPANVLLSLEEGDGYVRSPLIGDFDIIVIDGIRRAECAKAALPALNPAGVIVWDNTDEEADRAGHRLLETSGFRRLDFWGFGPLLTFEWCTSIFYRPDNCLGI